VIIITSVKNETLKKVNFEKKTFFYGFESDQISLKMAQIYLNLYF
jgi:hypothetical protein